jgi:acylphosphatase
MIVTRSLRIRGDVQGVGFRMYLQREALARGVAGWVRNRMDGSVEAVLHGRPEAVDAVTQWARHGPPKARVSDVHVSEAEGSYKEFELRHTE